MVGWLWWRVPFVRVFIMSLTRVLNDVLLICALMAFAHVQEVLGLAGFG